MKGYILCLFLMIQFPNYDSKILPHPLSNAFINTINNMNTTWKADRNFRKDINFGYLKRLMGVHPDAHKYKLPRYVHAELTLNLPVNFDSRSNWPECPTLQEIEIRVLVDHVGHLGQLKLCLIEYVSIPKAKFTSTSLQKIFLVVCEKCGYGCNGGFPGSAWNYWVTNGLVSGGNFGSKQGCQPYEIEPCEHQVKGGRPPCTTDDETPQCNQVCEENYVNSYENDRHFGANSYSIYDENQIKEEIYKNGPVEATFTVYEDFLSYRNGVYQHVAGDELGGHAVKILGWGVENNTPYWLAANSWNSDWGDNGFFKILRGKDHCAIESDICAGIPKC